MVKSEGIAMLANAGIRIKEPSLVVLGEEFGYELEYAPEGPSKNGTQNKQ